MTRVTRAAPWFLLVPLALLVLLVAGTWWLLRGPASSPLPTPDPGSEPVRAVGASPPPAPERRPDSGPDRVADLLAELSPAEARQRAWDGQVEVYGVVRSAGSPVAGAEVWMDGVTQAATDGEGRYRFVAPFVAAHWVDQRPRGATLLARHPDHGCAVVACPPRGGRVDLELAPGGTLRVQTVDQESGRRIGPATLEVHVYPQWEDLPLQQGFVLETRTDAQGLLQLDALPPGRVALCARTDQYGMLRFEQRHARDADFGVVTLALSRAQTFLGRFSPWPPPFATTEPPLTLGATLPALRVLETRLAEDGGFSLAVLRPATKLTLHLAQGDTILWHQELEDLPFEGLTDLGVLELAPAGVVRGSLSLDRSWVDQGLAVHLQYLDDSQARRVLPLAEDLTFDSGPAPTGLFTLGLVFHDQVLDLRRGTVASGEVHQAPPWELPAGVWAGRVEDTAGRGIRTPLVLTGVRGEGAEPAELATWTSDADGWFVGRGEGALARRLQLEVRDADGRSLCAVDLDPGCPLDQPLLLEVPPVPVLEGRLLDSRGNPLAGWAVHLTTRRQQRLFDLTGADGSFGLPGAGRGPWTALLVAPDGSSYAQEVAAPARPDALLTLRLDPAASEDR